MIIYADTSALVKLFVSEDSSQATRTILDQALTLGTVSLTRVELVAALARARRRGILGEDDVRRAGDIFRSVWSNWAQIAMDEDLVLQAETFAWDLALRGYDAVHLAAAWIWQTMLESPVTVATFDQELWAAARDAGLGVWPERL
jgi:predicted nucleic acid-binding protein